MSPSSTSHPKCPEPRVAATLRTPTRPRHPQTGVLGGAAVLLSSVDRTTRKMAARKDVQRSRPPRIFISEKGVPRLSMLQDRMVVRLQLVLESVNGWQACPNPGFAPALTRASAAETRRCSGHVCVAPVPSPGPSPRARHDCTRLIRRQSHPTACLSQGLGYDTLIKVTVQLISGRDSSYVIESYSTREIKFPYVRQWEEVSTAERANPVRSSRVPPF